MKKHTHVKTHVKKYKKVHSQKLIILFFLSLVAFACIVLYKSSRESVLGTTSGSVGTDAQQGSEIQPTTKQIQPTSPQVVQPTAQPITEPITQPTTVPNPQLIPTPTLVVPVEPIYVPVIDPLKEDPATVDLAHNTTTVIIEQTAGGLVTTTEQLTPKTEPVTQEQTIITSQTSQTTQTTQVSTIPQTPITSQPSVIDKFIALLSGQAPEAPTVQETSTVNTSSEQAKTENQPVLYQQVYVSNATTPTYTTDSTQTLAALDRWLGLNDMKLSSSSVKEFSISQGGIEAIVHPTDGKMAVNMSRMVALINTPTGFKELAHTVKNATDYSIDLNIVSKVKGVVTVRDTPTELVYDYTGVSDQYLLAFIPIGIEKNVCVSAKTKEICGVKQTLLSRVLDLFSI